MFNELDYLEYLVKNFEMNKTYLPNVVASTQLDLIASTMDRIIKMGKGDLIPAEYGKYRARGNFI